MRQALGWPASTWGEFPACAQGLKARGSQLPLELRRQTREPEQQHTAGVHRAETWREESPERRGASKTHRAPRRPEHGQHGCVRGLPKREGGPSERRPENSSQSSHRPGSFHMPSSPSANPLDSQHIKQFS